MDLLFVEFQVGCPIGLCLIQTPSNLHARRHDDCALGIFYLCMTAIIEERMHANTFAVKAWLAGRSTRRLSGRRSV